MIKKNPSNILDLAAKLLFAISFLLAVWLNLSTSNTPILEEHGFRQTQTALTSFYLKKDGFKLAYETPVIGEPWSIPFEFPIYQVLVAFTAKVFGAPLTQTGRIWGFAFEIFCCIPLYFLMKKLRFNDRQIFFCLTLFLSSPIYMFWSGTFMIESAALFFAIVFLYFLNRYLEGDYSFTTAFLLFASLALSLLQKATTALPLLFFLLPALILWSIQKVRSDVKISVVIKLNLALAGAMILLFSWVGFADALKALNPIGANLTSSALSKWNYGSIEQKISKTTLEMIFVRGENAISFFWAGFVCTFLALINYFNGKRNLILIGLLLSFYIAPFLIFTNLYLVHEYYQYANSVYIIIAFGLSIIFLLDKFFINRPITYILILVILIGANYYSFYINYYHNKSRLIDVNNNRTLAIAKFIRENTPIDKPIIAYGYDWSSELAFYSERRYLTMPWGRWDLEAVEFPENFLSSPPSTYIICPYNGNDYAKISNAIKIRYHELVNIKIQDCNVYMLKNN